MGDFLQELRGGVDNDLPEGSGSGDGLAASMENLMRALNDMPGMALDDMPGVAEENMAEYMKGFSDDGFGELGDDLLWQFMLTLAWTLFIIIGLIFLIILLTGFIGYKIYKKIVRGRKKEELNKVE